MDSERRYYQDDSYLETPADNKAERKKDINPEIEDLYNRYKKLSWPDKISFKKLLR